MLLLRVGNSDRGLAAPSPVQNEARGEDDHGGCHEPAQVRAEHSEQAEKDDGDSDHNCSNSQVLHGCALLSEKRCRRPVCCRLEDPCAMISRSWCALCRRVAAITYWLWLGSWRLSSPGA